MKLLPVVCLNFALISLMGAEVARSADQDVHADEVFTLPDGYVVTFSPQKSVSVTEDVDGVKQTGQRRWVQYRISRADGKLPKGIEAIEHLEVVGISPNLVKPPDSDQPSKVMKNGFWKDELFFGDVVSRPLTPDCWMILKQTIRVTVSGQTYEVCAHKLVYTTNGIRMFPAATPALLASSN